MPTNQVAAGTGAWRVALHIGDTPGYSSSSSWPMVVKCDFSESSKTVTPQDPNVRYTVQAGQVVKPISPGAWSLQSNNKSNKSSNNLAFSLNFPEQMSRNDLKMDAGTTITCEGLLYTLEELQILNNNFYQARDRTWELGGQLNKMDKQRDAPKKWSDERKQWEKRNDSNEPVWSYLAKRAQHLQLKTLEAQANAKRPDPQALSSDSGYFPGFTNTPQQQVFMGKGGIIKQGQQVIGTWAAEPINGRPVSYSGN